MRGRHKLPVSRLVSCGLLIALGFAFASCSSVKSVVDASLNGTTKEVHPINGEKTLVLGNCQRLAPLFSPPQSDSEMCQSRRDYHCGGASVVRSVKFDRMGSNPIMSGTKITGYSKFKLYNVVFTCTGQPSSFLGNS